MILIVNKRNYRGSTENLFYCGRGSPLGNPFTHIKDRKTKAEFIVDTRDEAIEKYEGWLRHALLNDAKVKVFFDLLVQHYLDTGELILSCYCVPANCHCFVIKKFIEEAAKI